MYELNSSFKYCEQLYCGEYHSGPIEFVANSLAKKINKESSQLDYLPFKMKSIPVYPAELALKKANKSTRNYSHIYKNDSSARKEGS
jgi:hypothetical protein